MIRQFHPRRYRPGNLGTWSGHLPFANELIWAMRPRVLVELGTHYGESYFGFSQAVEESGAGTTCFAVDTWLGDEHAGFYSDEVYREVQAYNREHYAGFSHLIRSTFDEASERFDTESIDLLHIDGLHTYEAVKHDWEVWFDKVRPGGIVLLHDTHVRHGDFEVWRLWKELAGQYSHFEFRHCWGLGVLQKPGGEATPDLVQGLFEANPDAAEAIRAQYSEAAELLEARERGAATLQGAAEANRPYLQVFPGMRDVLFQESTSVLSNVEHGVSKRHILNLPQGVQNGLIRIDILNRPGLVAISEIVLRLPGGGLVTDVQLPRDLSRVRCEAEVMPLPADEGTLFFCWGNDPQLILEVPDAPTTASGLQFEITMRVQFSFEPLRELLAKLPEGDELRSELGRMRAALSRENHAKARLQWSLAAAETQVVHLQKQIARLARFD